jgi:hypothetical protein
MARRTTREMVRDLEEQLQTLRRQGSLVLFLVFVSLIGIAFPGVVPVLRIALIAVGILVGIVIALGLVQAARSWVRYRRAVRWAEAEGLLQPERDPEGGRGSGAVRGASRVRGPGGPDGGS